MIAPAWWRGLEERELQQALTLAENVIKRGEGVCHEAIMRSAVAGSALTSRAIGRPACS
jgi:hypothetical protein